MADPNIPPAAASRWSKVVITDAAGEPISETNPLRSTVTQDELVLQHMSGQGMVEILAELRVISRLLAIGLNVADDVEVMRSEEVASVGV